MRRSLLLGLLLGALSPVAAPAQTPDPGPREVVERFLAAYNVHDVPAMLGLVDPEVQWLTIAGEAISVEATGVEALQQALVGYLSSVPSARSTAESVLEAGRFVSVRERAHWSGRNGERSQIALSVYEVEGGRIRRVWYYPAQP